MTLLIPIESTIFGKLLTSNIILVIFGEYPDPPYPPYGGAKVFFGGECLIDPYDPH